MAVTREKFKSYDIVITHDSGMPYGGIFVPKPTCDYEYLTREGEWEDACGNGWFDSVEHAKKVICKYLGVPYGPIIGGE